MYPNLFYYASKTYQQMLDRFLNDERLKAILSQLWGYYGLPPARLSAFYFSYPSYDFFLNGGYYPNGGSSAISNALAKIIEENGGTVILEHKVEKIIIRGGVVKGVVIKKEKELFADIVISNVNAYITFCNLIEKEHLPMDFIREIKKMTPSISALQIYLGLNFDLSRKGIFEEDYEVFINPNYDLNRQFKASIINDAYEVPFVLTFYSKLISNFAAKGKFVMGITALSGYDFWSNLSKEEYERKKETVTNVLIKRAEEFIPNLSSYIDIIEIATPLTMERHTGNHKGAIYGWSQNLSQSGIRRLEYTTPIKNLYLVGAWTQPGGGLSAVMLSGERVAEAIFIRNKS